MGRVRRKLRSTVETVQKQLELSLLAADAARRELQAARLEASAAKRSTEEVVRSRAELERGYRRLSRLYEIGKLLLDYGGEASLRALFAEVARVVPLRTAVLIDATGELPALRIVSVRARGVSDGDLAAAEAAALRALPASGIAVDDEHLELPTQRLADLDTVGAAASGSRDLAGSLALLPLLLRDRPAAGLLLLEASRRVTEAEGVFLRAVADQVALALERHAARLRDVRLREEATAIERQKQELMAIVSHDLRNPLGAVLLGVSTLQRKPQMDEGLRREHLAVIRRAASRANRLIHDLLDVGRLEEGHLALACEPVALGPLLDEAVELLKPLAEEREVSCRGSVPTDLPAVLADRERILQVFSNLIGNAIRYSQPGGTIEVGAALDGLGVRCTVADDGPGIAPADLPQVFDRYFQGAPRDGHARGGAGLGLAIAKGIVEAHGGRIWVEPAAGRGCCFVFTLPAVER